MELLEEILKFSIGGLTVVGIVVFLGKLIITKSSDLLIENHKKKLEQENKNFQHSLDVKLNEFNIQFSKLHQDRAEVVKKLYHRIIELQSAMQVFTRRIHFVEKDAEKEKQERIDRVNKALEEFINFYMPNKIYFDKGLAHKLDKLASDYRNNGWDFANMSNFLSDGTMSKELYADYTKKTGDISELVKNKFPKIIEELEVEFRTLLGVK
jgi:hypothetical protein